MCQDCYDDTDLDEDWGDDGYEPDPGYCDDDDDDDGWQEYKDGVAMGWINPDGSQREPDPPETGPDPWDWHPSLRDRIGWLISGWRRRLDMKRHPDRYYDEPPF